jgi:23S rRNA pseudouridine2457 synthase
MLIAFHKPYGVLSQFSESASEHRTLKEFGFPRGVYPVGRLDADSEGLLLLSDEGPLVDLLLDPRHGHRRLYWVQVEKIPSPEALRELEKGVKIGDHTTRPSKAQMLDPQPDVPPRDPPIRVRPSVPDCWIAMELTEGKNRQVRRMTASVGHPTLRLIRRQIGNFELGALASGTWRELDLSDRTLVLAGAKPPKEPIAPKRRRPQNRRS